jgi:hypothetical protein
MIRAFTPKPLVQPPLFRRLLGKPDPENGYVEVENLLASRAWDSIHEGNIEDLLRRHGVIAADRNRLKQIYSTALRACIEDDELTPEEVGQLDRLRKLLSISDSEVQEVEEAVVHPRYEQAVARVLRDEKISEEEREKLSALRAALRIEERSAVAMLNRHAEPILTQNWKTALSDQRLSPQEKAALDAMAQNFGITVDLDSASQAQLDRFRWFWLVENGTFPEIAAPINLQRGEVCHYYTATELNEMRTETVRTNYAGPSARIRIMKGVYYRIGSVRTERVTREVLRPVDSGTLYVTNKRLIFDGSRKNSTIRLSNILAITPYAGAVEVEKTTGRNPLFMVDDPEWLSILLSSRLAHD